MATAVAENQESALEKNTLMPKELAVVHLRRVCEGLLRDYGTICLRISLHPMVKNQRDKCHRLGISTQVIKEVIDSYRK